MSLTADEEITLQTYNKLAKSWASGHLNPDYWREELTELSKQLPKGKILEVGCGGGRDAKELLKLGYEYTGTDLSVALLKEARAANPSATFIQASLYDLDFPEQFDGFWCAAVLLHIPKHRIHEALQAIKRNVKKDGVGFIAIKEGTFEGVETGHEYDGDGRFFAYWQNDEFKAALAANGFKVVKEARKPLSKLTTWLVYFVRIQ
jgi:2-polyprenyl-3-methyl-5-hydroxy-6-metoxy-1,4-benzoquinol methylase